jgi:DNA-binding response OmpR family regulator
MEMMRGGPTAMLDEPHRILVVEDETLVAMLVEDALHEAGYAVIGPARTVSEAMRLLEDDPPHVVVLDLNLAGESSGIVADTLAARGIPFLLATGYGAAGVPAQHRNAPVLAKPYDPADLTAAVGRLCAAA